MERYKKRFKQLEAEDSDAETLKSIQALIDMNKIDTAGEQGKFLELVKGLVFSKSDVSNKFLAKINDFTSGLKKADFEEGCKKKPKKKDMSSRIG